MLFDRHSAVIGLYCFLLGFNYFQVNFSGVILKSIFTVCDILIPKLKIVGHREYSFLKMCWYILQSSIIEQEECS